MTKSTSVLVGDHFADFIERQVRQGRYDSASDVVRAGLRLLEEHELRLERLRGALIEGEQSGEATPFDFDQFIEQMTPPPRDNPRLRKLLARKPAWKA